MTVNEEYTETRTCTYKNETFSVRNNGAILRHSIPGSRKRPSDDIWTFGKKNPAGYAVISNVRVHQVVARAFHGEPEYDSYVVDHIDTNRMNNRPENLRWCSRLENLLNENTIWNIEHLTGYPIEEILKDTSILHRCNLPKNIEPMRQVRPNEEKMILEHLKERNRIPATYNHESYKYPVGIKPSLTPNAAAPSNWADYEFPSCPDKADATLEDYFENINVGEVFAQSKSLTFLVTAKSFNKWKSRICLETFTTNKEGKPNIKTYGIMIISKLNDYFLHKGEPFFQEDGMEKYYTIAQGYSWTGGEVFDDGCR